MKERMCCQSRLPLPLQVEHGGEGGICYLWCLPLFTPQKQGRFHLSFPRQTLGVGRILQPSQCDMKVMAEIPDFAPGPWCQKSPPDNKVQPAISLLGSLQSWGTASRVGVRKTSPSLSTQAPPGARRGRQETGYCRAATLFSALGSLSALCLPLAECRSLARKVWAGTPSPENEGREETGSEQHN